MTTVITNVDQFRELLEGALNGKPKDQAALKEAITTSDLGGLLRATVNAEMEEQYPTLEPVWREFASPESLSDFRPAALYELIPDSEDMLREIGGETVPGGLPRVPELTPYPTIGFTQGEKWFQTVKRGVRVHFSFEAFVNDEWGQIARLPAEMLRLAAETEDVVATRALVTEAGINTANFNAANDNILKERQGAFGDILGATTTVPDNAPLSLDSLFAAIQQVSEQKVNGRSVRVNNFVLVVPPNLEQLANMIVNAAQVRQTIGDREFEFANPLPARIKVVANEWLTSINQAASAATTWFLLPAGGRTANGRKTIVETFLRGRETPEMRVSGVTGRYIGGGDVPYTEGSFDNDDAEIRLRHIVDSAFLNAGGTIASDGTGS